jgi:protein tyrosine/serine phosphatase
MQLYNFRDLGGLTTKSDHQIKNGLLYRTGNVAHWSHEAAEHIKRERGVRLYIDLRNDKEIVTFGKPEALLKQNIEWMRLSIDTHDEEFSKTRLPVAKDWLSLYQRIFEKNLSTWLTFSKVIAEASEPILYGCLFGKDRTGIGTSMILNLLEVHDQQIAADYAKTTDHVKPLSDLFSGLLENFGASEEELFEHYSRSHEHVMLAFLEFLRTHPEDHILGRELKTLEYKYREPLKKRLLVKS